MKLLSLFLAVVTLENGWAFPTVLPPRSARSSLRSGGSSDNHGDEPSMGEAERMAAVRRLQKSYYAATASDDPRPTLDPRTGILSHLPLWRVGWVEVPGRTNCLNVHEGQYTHMFEGILRGPQPWYVGHLNLPGGSQMARTGKRRFLLKNWRQEIQDDDRYQHSFGRSAVIGCLLQITDHRRLDDGRLCLFVQALERFVVERVVREFPYSVADVQMLPDLEELPEGLVDENYCKLARGSAVQTAFQYHPYEYAIASMPINENEEYTSVRSMDFVSIAKMLPFASYSRNESLLDGINNNILEPAFEEEGFVCGEPPLEKQLQNGRLLKDPPRLSEDKKDSDLDDLETMLWLALEDLVRKTGFVLPLEILVLQPSHLDYLDLKKKKPLSLDENKYHLEYATPHLSPKYPAYRRQKRLSYSLPSLLENSRIGEPEGMRQAYLDTPSTKARLEAVLERLELLNASLQDSNQK